MGFNSVPYEFPYELNGKVINDLADVWQELLEIEHSGLFTPGQTLYYRIPGICRSELLFDPWAVEMINDYMYSTNYNLPIARSLDEADAIKLDCFDIIRQELNACKQEIMRTQNASRN